MASGVGCISSQLKEMRRVVAPVDRQTSRSRRARCRLREEEG